MAQTLHHFLLVYDYAEGRLVRQDVFTDATEASAAYARAEREHKDQLADLEIVLVGSDSIETIMRTHGHYFVGRDETSPFAIPA